MKFRSGKHTQTAKFSKRLSIHTVTSLRDISEKTWVHSYPMMPQATLCLSEYQTLARCHSVNPCGLHCMCVTCTKKRIVAMGVNILKCLHVQICKTSLICMVCWFTCTTTLKDFLQPIKDYIQYCRLFIVIVNLIFTVQTEKPWTPKICQERLFILSQ